MKFLFTPARVASTLTGIATLTAALAPAVANLDVTSAASGLGGAVVLLGILDRFLVGQRAHEARQAKVSALAPAMYVGSGTGNVSGGVGITGTIGTITPTPAPVPPAPVEIPPSAPAPPGDFVPPPTEPTITGG